MIYKTWHKVLVGGVSFALISIPFFFKDFFSTQSPSLNTLTAVSVATYSPTPFRTAIDTASPNGPFSDSQIQTIITSARVFDLPKMHIRYDVVGQIQDVARLVAVAKTAQKEFEPYMYYNATFWFTKNFGTKDSPGWGPYLSNFSTNWYLKDVNGVYIKHKEGHSDAYVLDLSNPDYRAYAIATITDWMNKSGATGIKFDSADILDGSSQDKRVDEGKKTWNEILCPKGAPVDAQGNCDRVAAWNAGLTSLVTTAVQTLHPMGKKVFYNGISPTETHGGDRNLSLLAVADGAMNEAFCYGGRMEFHSFIDDAILSAQQAAKGKQIVQITMPGDNVGAEAYDSYCFGGFLMGWQPGYTFWVNQSNYQDDLSVFPKTKELYLNLGNPNAVFVQLGDILTRTFDRGFVAVNMSTTTTNTITVPSALVQFQNGVAIKTLTAGDIVTLPPQSAAFFISKAFALDVQKKVPTPTPYPYPIPGTKTSQQ